MAMLLVPLDGSVFAEGALPHALLLARTLSADIMLLRVLTRHEQARLLTEEIVEAWDDTMPSREECDRQVWLWLREEAERYLAAQVQRLRAEGLAVESRVLFGDPATAIVEQIEASRPALVLMASHGYSGFQRWALGSVTERVVSASSAPVMVVRSSAKPSALAIRRILVPLDGSPFSAQALPLALLLAQRARAELSLLRVVAPPLSLERELPLSYSKNIAQVQLEVGRQLQATASALRQEHRHITSTIAQGHAAEEIVAAAAIQGADLIIMATHGHSGLRRWALGSTADKVLRTADVPLILVRNPPVA